MPHQPVLLNEVIELLDLHPGAFVIDGTVDGGGHASAILERITPGGRLLGIDWDADLLEKCRARIGSREGVSLVHGNYADLPSILEAQGLPKADALLLDLGFSSEQLEGRGRGFGFGNAAIGEPLLMTYDDSRSPVRELLKEIPEADLADIIYTFGGERFSRRIAKAIKERERKVAIRTSGELAETVRAALPKSYEHGRIDPATRTFQALRIYANGELENLSTILNHVNDVIAPGGRVAIISFHSLEDGMVKKAFAALSKQSRAAIVTKKPIAASRAEIKENPRSRSAKLRAITII